MKASIYVNDATIFVAPHKEDIQNLSSILTHLGEATGLATNFQKIMVVPIRFQEVDLVDVLDGLSINWGPFLVKF
jgi:hypothetical protein